MRLWSIHPSHLDSKGLVALWREALLAQAVLRGETTGYRHHPQLARFEAQSSPNAYIGEYLRGVFVESVARGYRFDESKIAPESTLGRIEVSQGQLAFEWQHLMSKLAARTPEYHDRQKHRTMLVHPLFTVKAGDIEAMERR